MFICMYFSICPRSYCVCWLETFPRKYLAQPAYANHDENTQFTYRSSLCSIRQTAAFPILFGQHQISTQPDQSDQPEDHLEQQTTSVHKKPHVSGKIYSKVTRASRTSDHDSVRCSVSSPSPSPCSDAHCHSTQV